jgi:hypothetical protein
MRLEPLDIFALTCSPGIDAYLSALVGGSRFRYAGIRFAAFQQIWSGQTTRLIHSMVKLRLCWVRRSDRYFVRFVGDEVTVFLSTRWWCAPV